MATMILVLIIAVLVTLFSVQNAMPVSISFLSWKFDASLAIVALLFFLAGVLAGAGTLVWIRIRRNAKKRRIAAEKTPEKTAESKVGFQ